MMDPTEKKWIDKYIELRSVYDFSAKLNHKLSFEKKLYKYLQPSGIIYGHPIDLPKEIEIDTTAWPVKERLQVILFESLLASYLLKNNFKGSIAELNSAVIEIESFYNKTSTHLTKKSFFESSNRSEAQILEKLFAKRVSVKAEWNSNFWQGFFHNILLFGDVIVFVEYLNNPKLTSKDLMDYLRNMHIQIIHLLSINLNINKDTKEINVKYFQYFVESTILNKQDKKDASNWHKASYESKFQYNYNKTAWLKRKYLLDLVALSVWADKSVSLLEKEMMAELAQRLSLDKIELDESGFAVESFVLCNWNKVHYLQKKQTYLVLSKRIIRRLQNIIEKYSGFIKTEIAENKELIALLKTSQERNLSIEEKNIVRMQLVDILKFVPTFAMLAMPMPLLTIPILLKILPNEMFPSSFNPNSLTVPRNLKRNNIIEG